ncbi:MAG: insulinase family protein, partial [Gemmatimonadaceae bacterium]
MRRTFSRLLGVGVLAACSGAQVVTTTPPVPLPASTAPVAAIDLTKPPTLGAPPSLNPPQITTRELSNGLRIVVVEQHELPLADMLLQVRTGGEADPAGKMGAAALVAAMLTEGTATRSALQIADQAAYLGVTLGATSSWEQSTVSLHTTTAQLDSALALFADVALRP